RERWPIPRERLGTEAPALVLENKSRRLVAEWLAKRYIRAAFPTAFDRRWRPKMSDWLALLQRHSSWIQGIYLRLNTLAELVDTDPYRCDLIVAVPAKMKGGAGWAATRDEIDREVASFWEQFEPSVEFEGVDVLGTDEISLADIETYQRFDADWVSFADDSAATPAAADMTL